MTDDKDLIIAFLLDELANTLHHMDSALQVAQELPDWQQKYRVAWDNPLRVQYTEERVAARRELAEGLKRGSLDDTEFLKLTSELRAKDPN